jgi:hypothetical protein
MTLIDKRLPLRALIDEWPTLAQLTKPLRCASPSG